MASRRDRPRLRLRSDLVFLCENKADNSQTNGERPIEVGHFYLKLAQRILHLFSTRTTSGEL